MAELFGLPLVPPTATRLDGNSPTCPLMFLPRQYPLSSTPYKTMRSLALKLISVSFSAA
jgi:hypothetical protein